jgi:hypothetical protein
MQKSMRETLSGRVTGLLLGTWRLGAWGGDALRSYFCPPVPFTDSVQKQHTHVRVHDTTMTYEQHIHIHIGIYARHKFKF